MDPRRTNDTVKGVNLIIVGDSNMLITCVLESEGMSARCLTKTNLLQSFLDFLKEVEDYLIHGIRRI